MRNAAGRLSRVTRVGLAAVGLLAGAACADFDRVLDIAFPPEIAGLPSDSAWAALPIGSWITEGSVQATAMAACFSSACPSPVVVGGYRVGGGQVRLFDELAADPARLVRYIEERDRRDPNARRRKITTRVTAERFTEGAYRGLAVHMARADGSRPAVGLLAARPDGGERDAVLVIGPDEEVARRVLSSVLASRS